MYNFKKFNSTTSIVGQALIALFLVFSSNYVFSQAECHAAYPTITHDGKYIIFCSTMESDNYQIFKSDINGENIVRLSYSSENDFFPDASPNGKWIVFQRGTGSYFEIFRMDLDGKNLIQLTDNSIYDGKPSFSPDSYSIAYSAWDQSPYPEIFVMDVTGENIKQITADPGATWHHNPVYSPDGKYIYFAYGTNANNQIVRMTADGNTWKDITLPNDFGYDEADFDINHDGSKIVFQTTEYHGYNNGMDVVIMNSDGTGWKALSSGVDKEYFYAPCFNPKGGDNKIYFTYLKDLNSKSSINTMTFDGLDIQTVLFCQTVSVSQIQKENPNWYYPNPTNNLLILSDEIPSDVKKIIFYDILGNYKTTISISDKFPRIIDVSSFADGVYILKTIGADWGNSCKIAISK